MIVSWADGIRALPVARRVAAQDVQLLVQDTDDRAAIASLYKETADLSAGS